MIRESQRLSKSLKGFESDLDFQFLQGGDEYFTNHVDVLIDRASTKKPSLAFEPPQPGGESGRLSSPTSHQPIWGFARL